MLFVKVMITTPPKRISIVTLGCEKNTVDSEVLMGGLKRSGVELVNDPSLSNIIILNTCGFIESAKQESINSILEAVEMKNNGTVTTCATGAKSFTVSYGSLP